MYTTTHATPRGTLTAIVDDDEVVHAAGFTTPEVLADRMQIDPPPVRTGTPTAATIRRYLDGDLSALDELAIDQPGTAFQQQVWTALRAVPAGETATYSELAQRIGRPAAVRAVGTACGRNLVAPFVPCHRAVRTDGSLGGYLYGLDVKDWLLRHESGHH
ncbi:methylated-DNA--[protein]-cysteine S-methyltransferase [Euzebya tangerina]|uniref:methylated-DNA--[protein]-cysteine S-methyltransferase n=1 Tax=Euzebya tangerina TaxID=591198 RepID=UPI000E30BF90|nr:methylated-DNA--[protein]-cysteine S-methyltransferase [Euzebya tangerina]